MLDNYNVKVEKCSLPVQTRQGIGGWQGRQFSNEIKNCCRIYPQDNDSEGFFVAKIKLLETAKIKQGLPR